VRLLLLLPRVDGAGLGVLTGRCMLLLLLAGRRRCHCCRAARLLCDLRPHQQHCVQRRPHALLAGQR
jgi:hypothetical protein